MFGKTTKMPKMSKMPKNPPKPGKAKKSASVKKKMSMGGPAMRGY